MKKLNKISIVAIIINLIAFLLLSISLKSQSGNEIKEGWIINNYVFIITVLFYLFTFFLKSQTIRNRKNKIRFIIYSPVLAYFIAIIIRIIYLLFTNEYFYENSIFWKIMGFFLMYSFLLLIYGSINILILYFRMQTFNK